jgi:hypothetical protein
LGELIRLCDGAAFATRQRQFIETFSHQTAAGVLLGRIDFVGSGGGSDTSSIASGRYPLLSGFG